jgi:hypothetical protein
MRIKYKKNNDLKQFRFNLKIYSLIYRINNGYRA